MPSLTVCKRAAQKYFSGGSFRITDSQRFWEIFWGSTKCIVWKLKIFCIFPAFLVVFSGWERELGSERFSNASLKIWVRRVRFKTKASLDNFHLWLSFAQFQHVISLPIEKIKIKKLICSCDELLLNFGAKFHFSKSLWPDYCKIAMATFRKCQLQDGGKVLKCIQKMSGH